MQLNFSNLYVTITSYVCTVAIAVEINKEISINDVCFAWMK